MNSRSRALLVAAAVSIVLLAIVAVAFAGGDDDDGDVTTGPGGMTIQQYQAVDVRGAALPRFDSGIDPAADPAVGTPAPQLIGHGFDGTPVHIEADGKPKLLLFVAHWCPHCQNEVPVVRDWIESGNAEGVDVYAISTDASADRPNWTPSSWLEDEKWPAPVLVDDRTSLAGKTFGLISFPFYVWVNADGTVALRGSGEVPADQLTKVVSQLK